MAYGTLKVQTLLNLPNSSKGERPRTVYTEVCEEEEAQGLFDSIKTANPGLHLHGVWQSDTTHLE